MYYYSKTLQGAETRYSTLEKLAYVVVLASQRLRPYFQAHSITIPTAHPLLRILHKPDISDRLTKWAVELSGFTINIVLAKAIKGQTIVELKAELHPSPESVAPNEPSPWKIYVDGFSTTNGCGAGIVLFSPTGERIDHAIYFEFPATNNAAEYEAVISSGAKLAEALGATEVIIYMDSRLVANQIPGN